VINRRRIDFELKMPKARQVILMADFNQWNPKTHPMRKEENGVWRKTVMIYPGRYEYRSGLMGSGTTTPSTR
jgi:1,4-alpha-glucan branching enzyme